MTVASNRMTALGALVLCVVGAVFLTLAVRGELRARALADHGIVTLAEVTRIEPVRASDAGERVAYRFTVDGAAYEGGNRHLTHTQIETARELGRIEVRYLPEDPSASAPTQAATGRAQFVAFVLAGTNTMFGLALCAVLVSHKRRTGRFVR